MSVTPSLLPSASSLTTPGTQSEICLSAANAGAQHTQRSEVMRCVTNLAGLGPGQPSCPARPAIAASPAPARVFVNKAPPQPQPVFKQYDHNRHRSTCCDATASCYAQHQNIVRRKLHQAQARGEHEIAREALHGTSLGLRPSTDWPSIDTMVSCRRAACAGTELAFDVLNPCGFGFRV